jgi:hypothetical protein
MAFESKFGKKFGSKFAANRHSEDHSPDGMHKLGESGTPGGEETKEPRIQASADKGDAEVKSKRRDETAHGETHQKDETPEAGDVEPGNPEGMNQEEGSPDVDADNQEPRTDENGEATNEDVVPDDVKSAAAEHGPASKIVVTHDRETGRHAVASQHKDGHMHQSVHKDAKSAHASAKHLGMSQQTQPDVDDFSHLLG